MQKTPALYGGRTSEGFHFVTPSWFGRGLMSNGCLKADQRFDYLRTSGRFAWRVGDAKAGDGTCTAEDLVLLGQRGGSDDQLFLGSAKTGFMQLPDVCTALGRSAAAVLKDSHYRLYGISLPKLFGGGLSIRWQCENPTLPAAVTGDHFKPGNPSSISFGETSLKVAKQHQFSTSDPINLTRYLAGIRQAEFHVADLSALMLGAHRQAVRSLGYWIKAPNHCEPVGIPQLNDDQTFVLHHLLCGEEEQAQKEWVALFSKETSSPEENKKWALPQEALQKALKDTQTKFWTLQNSGNQDPLYVVYVPFEQKSQKKEKSVAPVWPPKPDSGEFFIGNLKTGLFHMSGYFEEWNPDYAKENVREGHAVLYRYGLEHPVVLKFDQLGLTQLSYGEHDYTRIRPSSVTDKVWLEEAGIGFPLDRYVGLNQKKAEPVVPLAQYISSYNRRIRDDNGLPQVDGEGGFISRDLFKPALTASTFKYSHYDSYYEGWTRFFLTIADSMAAISQGLSSHIFTQPHAPFYFSRGNIEEILFSLVGEAVIEKS